ncbi:uncharacterized protein A4U43_C01F32120, partial [Asparagus officinalis]
FDQISVTLWGDLAEIEGSSLENLKDAKPVVALLNIIARRYLGEFQLSTKSSTLVLVNPEIPQCREMIDCCRGHRNSRGSDSVAVVDAVDGRRSGSIIDMTTAVREGLIVLLQ